MECINDSSFFARLPHTKKNYGKAHKIVTKPRKRLFEKRTKCISPNKRFWPCICVIIKNSNMFCMCRDVVFFAALIRKIVSVSVCMYERARAILLCCYENENSSIS